MRRVQVWDARPDALCRQNRATSASPMSMPTTLSFSQIVASASHAFTLVARHPLRWLLLTLVYLVAVEMLMFIPYIGFLAKLAVAGIVGAQVLAVFVSADGGDVPRLRVLPRAFLLPMSSQMVLVLSAWIPFGIGLLQQGGVGAVGFFFGNLLTTHPPDAGLFLRFKYVMYLADLPFTFVAAAVALAGLNGWPAVVCAVEVARKNVLALGVLLAVSILAEYVMATLPARMPIAGTIASLVLLVLFLLWTFAFNYALARRALQVQ